MPEQYVERDSEEIAAEAYKEMEDEANGIHKETVTEEPKPVKDGKEEAETPDDTEQPDIEPEDEETDENKPKPGEEGYVEPETEESEEEKAAKKEEEKDEDAEITAYAEKHTMTYAEAKDDLDKTNKILEQFKDDPKEMAIAMRNKDREYDKLKNEIGKETEKSPPVFNRLNEHQFRSIATSKVEAEPDKYLEAFKAKYPKKSELLSDEAIIEEMIDKEWGHYQSYASEEETVRTQKAVDLRESFLTDIPKEDKRFLPEVKAFMGSISDVVLLQKGFDPSYMLQLAKGKVFDAEVKAAEERGFQRAKEGAKILGVKGGGHSAPTGKKVVGGLNQAQKDRAEEMFPVGDGYTVEKAYAEFKDTFKDDLKENPNYV